MNARLVAFFVVLLGALAMAGGNWATAAPPSKSEFINLVDQHCTGCHDADLKKGKLDLDLLLDAQVAKHASVWERALRKIDARHMPPIGKKRPSEAEYRQLTSYLVASLDAAAEAHPNAGRTDTFRRLNRTEYQNAIRDLLALEIDAASLLPPDESSHGFDHITVGDLSPALLTRYVSAAQKISRLAIGAPRSEPDGVTYRIPPDVTQESHVPGLPLGTRGGGLWRHHFPRDGEYEIQIRLTRDRNDEVEGLNGSHQLEVLVDRARVAQFTVARPKKRAANHFDDTKLKARFKAKAGPRDLGVTFVRNGRSLEETKRQPLNVHFNLHRHPRLGPAIYQVSIIGPFHDKADDNPSFTQTPSRKRVFIADAKDDEQAAARTIIQTLARRAYRRPVTEQDMKRPMVFFAEAHRKDGFEAGIEMALSAILTSPHFLFKIEREPQSVSPNKPYKISDIELASRLSFFLWSSIPDDELLTIAESGRLHNPDVLESQVRRMLADAKAESLATNFASQWLHLRNLDSIRPDGRLYPDFDHNLRLSMRRETELHFHEMVRRDASVLSLLRADHTYLNERLAKHYGIPHVYGSRFRRVQLPANSPRGGLLRHGSILTVTSYATRTSPVIRGNWVLENILGTPAPPPPEDVPSLDDSQVVSASLPVRERLMQHRADPACAGCHNLMDPVGFALEHFDAVGQWRDLEGGRPVDASGGLPDGSAFRGVAGLEAAILRRPEVFATTITEKLMIFGLGRGLEYYDQSAIRRIVRDAADDDYKFSAIVLGIVKSVPFQMRNQK